MRRLLLTAPLIALCWTGAASAQKGKGGEPPPPQPGAETMNRCLMKCQQPFSKCSEKCKGKASCNANCAKELRVCVEKCGVTPPPKE